ncbi:DUF2996 domain-containing protein [Leptolyngbya sp. FACHB-261]|uniref:DUF2996 domain-containing protein n=1 Tax=Leptolyngbya sp. FACHB-261 TaxID=2692806 RepID=UPI001688BE1F|nr:DUF2996 domain-containing protein [Leptolyngbya sp. FACHB-261]MBD2101280.1 DUF2996 domain-containing protein [Leptolyngbya sp. FACHB-261]
MPEEENAPQANPPRAPKAKAKAATEDAAPADAAATAPTETAEPKAEAAAPKAKAARVPKEKPPAPEDKPFDKFIPQELLPALTKAFAGYGISDLKLSFENNQVTGKWLDGRRQFTVYFTKPDIDAQKGFSCSDEGIPPSTIEPFLIDERKAPLDLLVFGVMQRLNAQKWFANN